MAEVCFRQQNWTELAAEGARGPGPGDRGPDPQADLSPGAAGCHLFWHPSDTQTIGCCGALDKNSQEIT